MRRFLTTAAAAVLALLGAGCGGDNPAGPGDGGSGPGPGLQFESFQPADVVIGQLAMDLGQPDAGGTRSAFGLLEPYCAGSGSFYLPDPHNNRVLGYAGVPDADGAGATFVLGQTSFIGGGPGTAADKLSFPADCVVDGGKLFVVDTNNNRVLIWNSLPTANTPADVVVGQPDFTSGGSGGSQTGMTAPLRVAVGGGRLFVNDNENNRVLVWDTIPTTNGAPADVVLGQPDFTSTNPSLSASSLESPLGMWTDGTKLAVGDAARRVLIWNTIPTSNGAPADVVVGEPDFTTALPPAPSDTTMSYAYGIASDGTSLFVADEKFNRVLIYTPFPTQNGVAATAVLGQSDFSHSAANDGNQDGTADAGPTARTLDFPADVEVIGDRLLVADQGNHRVLVYRSAGG